MYTAVGNGQHFQWKLWLYTNFDCNLRCSYCVAESSPQAPRRALGLDNVRRLVDEAVQLGFSEILFTGGEPFLLADIYPMLAYASAHLPTTVLTNAMLLRGRRLEKLGEIAHTQNGGRLQRPANLTVQVSLDGGRAEHHDAYRGQGTWAKTVEGIRALLAEGFHVRLSTTETPANTAHLDEVCELHTQLGIPEEDHLVRPLAKRGFSTEGLELHMADLSPEVTVSADGVFWHPLSTAADMQVSREILPLRPAVQRIQENLVALAAGREPLMTFT